MGQSPIHNRGNNYLWNSDFDNCYPIQIIYFRCNNKNQRHTSRQIMPCHRIKKSGAQAIEYYNKSQHISTQPSDSSRAALFFNSLLREKIKL